MPSHGRMMQWGLSILIPDLNVRTLVQQQCHLVDIPAPRCIKQKSILRILEKLSGMSNSFV